MLRGRTLVVVFLVVFHVGLGATASLLSADFAWAPSYFDDDDDDFLPLLLSERAPALVDPVAEWIPALTSFAALAARPPRGRSRLAVTCVRFRAPPCS
ncbi:MAG TPA: hypothetical protein VFS98_17540 [Methylomirabilota bacterium]|nr:hypothetical protein [Methylomirabilota bacterium]